VKRNYFKATLNCLLFVDTHLILKGILLFSFIPAQSG